MKKLGSNVIFNVLKTIMSCIFPLITFSYASRIFLSDGIGKLDFSKAVVSLFSLMATSGIVNYGTREAAKVRDNRRKLSHFSQELLIIHSVAAGFTYFMFACSLILIPQLEPYYALLLINSITIILNVIGMEWLYNAVEDFKYIAIRTTIIQIASLFCMLIFVQTKEDIGRYAFIQVFAVSGNSICNFFHSHKYIDYKPIGSLQIKKHLCPLAYIFCTWIFIQTFTHLDTVMLGIITNDNVVGLYTASHKISTLAGSVITSATMVLMPRISYYCEKNNVQQIQRLVLDTLNFLLMIAIPGTIGLIAVSKETLLLFSGEGFLQASLTTKIMAARVLLVPLNSFIVLHLFIPLQQECKNIISTACAAIINFILNLILIPQFAQNGAAIATVAAELIELIINIHFINKIMAITTMKKSIIQFTFASLFIILVSSMGRYFIFDEFIRLILVISLSIILYAGILVLLKNREIMQLKTIVSDKLQGN